jgi:general secretion pathway protein M
VPSSQLTHRVAAAGLLLLAVLLLFALVARPLWARYAANVEAIETLEDNVVRFEAIAKRQAAVEKELRRLEDALDLGALTFQADSATLAAANLQERVKSAVQQAGGSLTSTQVLEPEPLGDFERISVNVRMTGPTPVLQKSLYALESALPLLVVDDLLVVSRRAARRKRGQNVVQQDRLDVRYRVIGFYDPRAGQP